MDLRSFLRMVARHAWVVVLGLALTIGAAGYAALRVQPTYTTSGSTLLVPPNTVEDTSGSQSQTNPFFNLDASLTTFGNIIVPVVQSDTTQTSLARRNLSTDFTVTAEQGTPGIDLSVQAGTEARAMASYVAISKLLDGYIHDKQIESGAPATQLIRPVVLTAPSTTRSSSARLRVGAAVTALGIVFTIAAVFLIDLLGRLRRNKKRRRQGQADSASSPTESEETAVGTASVPARSSATAVEAPAGTQPTSGAPWGGTTQGPREPAPSAEPNLAIRSDGSHEQDRAVNGDHSSNGASREHLPSGSDTPEGAAGPA
jgi:capsular polysaccharide biosynthesis protein